jgi:hypothetical protein
MGNGDSEGAHIVLFVASEGFVSGAVLGRQANHWDH